MRTVLLMITIPTVATNSAAQRTIPKRRRWATSTAMAIRAVTERTPLHASATPRSPRGSRKT
jgi:hypothetical protein